MSQKVSDSYEVIAEEDEEEEEETERDDLSSWETKAEQLFSLCDRECKGFVTKRDLQRLWGELPLGPDELEGVFDSLDLDHNGFLTLQEFTGGFGHHLGLVVEFRADCDSNKDSEEEKDGGEDDQESSAENRSITSQQIDDILSCFAKHNFDISSSVVESVWQDVCQGDDVSPEGSGLGRLVTALLQELTRVKADQSHLEVALNAKTEQYNSQVSHLYEELESQISGERNKVEAEHNVKGARALASLEQELRDRESALRILQEDHTALIERVERLTAADLAAKQDNIRLTHHLSKLEEELSLKEREVEELSASVDHLRRYSKNEKRRRAQQAFKVSEGIALERESLVTQLDFLRTINTHLRDEQDTSDSIMTNTSSTRIPGTQEQVTVSAPVAAKRTSVSTAVTSIAPPVLQKPNSLSLHPEYDEQGSSSPEYTSQTPVDFEHDELYFENSTVNAYSATVMSTLTSPAENSLLQELLQQPSLCMSCGGKIAIETDKPPTSKSRVTFQKTDSLTQTSPVISVSREQQVGDFELAIRPAAFATPAMSPDVVQALDLDVVMPSKVSDEGPELQPSSPDQEHDNGDPSGEPKSCFKRPRDLDITRNCCCHRPESHSLDSPDHSSTLVLYHPGQPLPPDVLPKQHANSAYIHTQHRHHSHAYLAVKHLQSQSTCTQSVEDFECKNSESAEDGSHLAGDAACNEDATVLRLPSIDGEVESIDKVIAEAQNNANESADADMSNNQTKGKDLKKTQKTSSSSLLDEKMNNLKNLKDNIKSYISDKSQVFSRDNKKNCEREVETEIPVQPITTSRVFKIVFIGDSGVGKTTFIHRASIGEFRGDFAATVGVDYRLMEICVGGTQALLQLWDTAGQERYRAITRQYYRKADGVVVMYDVTCERSYLSVADWISSVRECGDSNMVMAIIGNKKDLQKARQISSDVAYKLSQAHNSLMYECSAATGCGVKEAMKHLAGILTTDQQHDIDTSATVTLHRSPTWKFNTNKCC